MLSVSNIQTFWAGTSFFVPGDSNELSYSLAEVFLNVDGTGRAHVFPRISRIGHAGRCRPDSSAGYPGRRSRRDRRDVSWRRPLAPTAEGNQPVLGSRFLEEES